MLTAKQERFAQLVAQGETQTDAYKKAFKPKTTNDKTIYPEASKIAANPKIRTRIEELRKPAVEAVQMTLEGHLRDLLVLRNMAVKAGNVNAAINAEVARGKASGVASAEQKISGDVNITLKLGDLKLNPNELGW